jgi:EAL and modified HD-GYP domain-containing signal transduction protein
MSDFCMVRQPVFSRDGDLIGYEIRFRDTPEGREAFSQSLLTGSFDSLRGDRPAFVPVSRGQFLEQIIQLADPLAVIPLIPNDVGDDPSVLEAIERFCAAGGQIAIDQLGETINASDALLPLAHWVRIDVRSEDYPSLAGIVARARMRPDTLLIADHVYETGQLAMAERLGFDAFEGAHFSRPEPLPSAELPSSTISALRLLGQARDPNVHDRTLEESIAIDPVLTFQLLRIVNSASVGARGVTSIGHALRLIGRSAFLRWLSLAIAASRRGGTGVDEHLVRQAVERARLCEQLAGSGRDAGTLFLVGLFSLLDAVFRVSIEELVSRVALTDDAREALLERTGPYAPALDFAEMYELAMFESAAEVARDMGVDPSTIGEIYAGALQWADEMLAPMAAANAPKARVA